MCEANSVAEEWKMANTAQVSKHGFRGEASKCRYEKLNFTPTSLIGIITVSTEILDNQESSSILEKGK